jgi:hypothetical protein
MTTYEELLMGTISRSLKSNDKITNLKIEGVYPCNERLTEHLSSILNNGNTDIDKALIENETNTADKLVVVSFFCNKWFSCLICDPEELWANARVIMIADLLECK